MADAQLPERLLDAVRRVRLLGLFDAVELPVPDAGQRVDREDPPIVAPEYDPLSDWLDEPFPEEYR